MKLLTASERLTLLKLARHTVANYLKFGTRPPLPSTTEALAVVCGAFVTLRENGELRGCIGNMVGRGSLVETVVEMAIAAATEDPRFECIRADELDGIIIEISVLSPLKRIWNICDIEVGTHGILMRRGVFQGVLLPQVAVEWGWEREEFLRHTCLKAGLHPESWKDSETVIEVFSAQVFGEDEG